MARSPNKLILFLRKFAEPKVGSECNDGDLLGRFRQKKDQTAFAEVVRRHGPMVFQLCQRILGNSHDAEDAFQATFLILARKNGSVSWQPSIANWLYQVAYHVALKAKAARAHRRNQEVRSSDRASLDPLDEITGRELIGVLDSELTRLPDRLREPLILCYLEGMSRDQAARKLRCRLGTLKSRLQRGRELLRSRLAKRGLSLATVGLAAGASTASVPVVLFETTILAATGFAGGAGTCVLRPEVVNLANAAMPLFKASGRLSLILLLSIAVTGTATGVLLHRKHSDEGSRVRAQAPGPL